MVAADSFLFFHDRWHKILRNYSSSSSSSCSYLDSSTHISRPLLSCLLAGCHQDNISHLISRKERKHLQEMVISIFNQWRALPPACYCDWLITSNCRKKKKKKKKFSFFPRNHLKWLGMRGANVKVLDLQPSPPRQLTIHTIVINCLAKRATVSFEEEKRSSPHLAIKLEMKRKEKLKWNHLIFVSHQNSSTASKEASARRSTQLPNQGCHIPIDDANQPPMSACLSLPFSLLSKPRTE